MKNSWRENNHGVFVGMLNNEVNEKGAYMLMKILKYRLFPEAYGGNGTFMDKEGTVGELVTDMGLLVNSDFDKVIPSMKILNELFLVGDYGRNGEWDPFELNENEYIELVEYLLKLPLNKKYRTEN